MYVKFASTMSINNLKNNVICVCHISSTIHRTKFSLISHNIIFFLVIIYLMYRELTKIANQICIFTKKIENSSGTALTLHTVMTHQEQR